MIDSGEFTSIVEQRYAGWQGSLGRAMLGGEMTLESISDGAVADAISPQPRSGRQELIEILVNKYI